MPLCNACWNLAETQIRSPWPPWSPQPPEPKLPVIVGQSCDRCDGNSGVRRASNHGSMSAHTSALDALRYTIEDAIAAEEKRQRVIEQMVEALREAEEWLSEHRGGRGDQVRESVCAILAAWNVLNQRKEGENRSSRLSIWIRCCC